MPAVLSTPARATVIYLSSIWPCSLHTSFGKMTFWSDLLSALAQLMLLSSSTYLVTAAADLNTNTNNYNNNNNFQTTTTFIKTSSSSSNSFTTVASTYQSQQSIHENSNDAFKHTINRVQYNDDGGGGGRGSNRISMTKTDTISGDVKMFNFSTSSISTTTTSTIKSPQLSKTPSSSSSSRTSSSSVSSSSTASYAPSSFSLITEASHYNNFTSSTTAAATAASLIVTDSSAINNNNNNNNINNNNLIDCNDFTEQKLLNIVICAISDVNSNVINGTSADNSTLISVNDSRNASDDFNRFYNTSDGADITGNNDTSCCNYINRTNDFVDNSLLNLLYSIQVITTAVVLGIIILATVIGNVFVIAAILLEKNLQSIANNLILSLAVADLLVACLVMPLSAVYEISREWKLGPELCDLWTSFDVLCCTASILHLVAIALDRFWAVTNIDYAHQRTARRIVVMIIIIWILSALVSIAPLLGWKDPEWSHRLEMNECLVSQDVGYQIFATTSSFYGPLIAILFLYWRIFLVARKRIRRRQQANVQTSDKPKPLANASKCNIPLKSTFGIRWSKVTYGQQQEQQKKKQMPATPTPTGVVAQAVGTGSGAMATAIVAVIGRPLPTISEATTTTTTTALTNISSTNTSPEKCSYGNGLDDRIEMDPPTSDVSCAYPSNISCPPHPIPNTWKKQQHDKLLHLNNNPAALLLNKEQQPNKAKPSILKKKAANDKDNSSKRERKAAKTLAIITGAFVVCWMPFFVIAVVLPVCGKECEMSPVIISFFLWLGYFNSTLNPILYTIFNQDFRNAFKRILCGRRNSVRRNRNRRMGREAR